MLVVFRMSGYALNQARLADGSDKRGLLRAIDRSRSALPLRAVLRVIRLSQSRYYTWTEKNHALSMTGRPVHDPRRSNSPWQKSA